MARLFDVRASVGEGDCILCHDTVNRFLRIVPPNAPSSGFDAAGLVFCVPCAFSIGDGFLRMIDRDPKLKALVDGRIMVMPNKEG